ncbi:MAG: NAD(P)H-binding protein [Acidobacteriota bacterium]
MTDVNTTPTSRSTHSDSPAILVLGGTGKTGRRIAEQLRGRGFPVRVGSRHATPSFDWHRESTWDACLEGVGAVYISYAPDLAIPGATDAIRALVERARHHGVKRLVLLSGRGEDEAQACERIVQASGLDWTVVRASWFSQNFSEGAFADMVQARHLTLPMGQALEPFVDVDDIADVAVAALTEPGHSGEVYEVTGPRLMTFQDIADALGAALGETVTYTEIPHADFIAGARASGAPKEVVWILDYLFSKVLDGRNAHVTDVVERSLGRPAKDFADGAYWGFWV